VVFALVAGRLFAGGLTGPILRVRDAAVAVGQGDYSRRLVAAGEAEAVGGELAELVAAFDRMSESLARSRRELDEKNAEIAAFAQELQVRVEQRTAQLREAQARLVQSGQLAAVAQLSAGVAHELNNPLAGALGAVQVARARLAGRPEAELLEAAEREALRCREIVARLLRFTESSRDEVTDEQADLARVLADVLALSAAALRERSITAALATPAAPVLLRADARALGRAFGQLVAALRGVAAPGATLRVDLGADGDEARVRFVLDGTTSGDDDWRAAGLAFWVARQVFDTHGATLEEPADTVEGVGGPRAWSLRFPRPTASP
jgi:C4-dicarboxylate-specific signal transduction histidine kinase